MEITPAILHKLDICKVLESAMTFKVFRQCVQYSSANNWLGVKGHIVVKPKVNSSTWHTHSQVHVDVARPYRGCRAGVKLWRPIRTVITNREALPPTIATGINRQHLVYPPVEDEWGIEVVTGNRADRVENDDKSRNKHNLIPIQTVKDGIIKQEEISMGYLNARSVRNKSQEINDYIVDNKLDIFIFNHKILIG